MAHRIEVISSGSMDAVSKGLILKSPIRVYNINDNTLTPSELKNIEALLADPIVDIAATDKSVLQNMPEEEKTIAPFVFIEKSPKPGVSDPHGKETKKAIENIMGRKIGAVSYGEQYFWKGAMSTQAYLLLQKQLGNTVTSEFRRINARWWDPKKSFGFHFPYVELPEVPAFTYKMTPDGLVINQNTTDQELIRISDKRYIALNLEEMQTIRDLFKDTAFVAEREKAGLEAMPADAEVEIFGQVWSEHCKHKKMNAIWEYTSDDPNDESGLPSVIDSLFKTVIVGTTYEIVKDIDYVNSLFKDNSGGFLLNERWIIAHKVETHNHPSGIDGLGGAGTGTGGILRDPKNTGKNMFVISSQYGFRTPHPDSYPDLPLDIQSPARTLETVVLGVEDYGNKMGMPTQCGQVMIDDGWLKPAVYVGAVSVAPVEINGRPTHTKDIDPGYILISLGGRVGKDGIHGATGSSTDLSADAEQKEEVNQSVQIGDPIVEKGMFEAMNYLFELDLIEASQDCGAGGWNSAVGELAALLNNLEKNRYKLQKTFDEKGITNKSSVEERLGVANSVVNLEKKADMEIDLLKREVVNGAVFERKSNGKGGVVMDLSKVLEKYPGLTGWEKLISEAQERSVIVIKPENYDRVMEICEHNNVEATNIAEFNDSGYYHVLDQDKTIAFLPIDFIDRGLPQMRIKAHWTPCKNKEPELPCLDDLTENTLKLLGTPNLQSYDWIVTRYDHEVQGRSLIKPLVGVGKGRSDAIAYRPVLTENEVAIESWGSNPWQGDIDAYHMGRNNVVDAIGRTIAVGGSLDKLTFNGNITCPKPEKDPHIAAQVERMIKGACDAELVFGTPTISGKDSTSMERSYKSTKTGKEVKVKAKPEYLMSSLGIIPDDSTLITSDFKLPGDLVYVVGDTRDELGASEYYLMHGETGRNVPKSDLKEIKERFDVFSGAVKDKLVHSAQYLGKGGLAHALSNSAMGGDLGVDVNLGLIDEGLGRADKIMFSETTGRLVVSVHPSKKKEFESAMQDVYVKEIGRVREDDEFNVHYNRKQVVETDVSTFREKNKGEIRY